MEDNKQSNDSKPDEIEELEEILLYILSIGGDESISREEKLNIVKNKALDWIEAYKNEEVEKAVQEERAKHCTHEFTHVNGFGDRRFCDDCGIELKLWSGGIN